MWEKTNFDAEFLATARKTLYGRNGLGYIVVKRFISRKKAYHICEKYNPDVVKQKFVPHPGKRYIYNGCPNYYAFGEKENYAVSNFLWAKPHDQLSRDLAIQVQCMRNQIDPHKGRSSFSEIFPDGDKAVSY